MLAPPLLPACISHILPLPLLRGDLPLDLLLDGGAEALACLAAELGADHCADDGGDHSGVQSRPMLSRSKKLPSGWRVGLAGIGFTVMVSSR